MINDDIVRKLARGMIENPVLFIEQTIKKTPYYYQEEILKSKERFISACWARQTGKSWIVRMKAIYQAFTNPDQLIIIISATERQALHFYRLMMQEIESSDLLNGEIARFTKTMAVLKNGSQIVCLAPSEKSVRGYSADMVIIDEADFVSREVIVAVEQTIVARRGTMIMISTPSPEGVGGIFYQYFNDAMNAHKEGKEHGDSGYVAFHYTYEVGLRVTRKEGKHWVTQLDPEMVRRKQATMAEWEWKREYMATWADDVGTYYNRLHIEACIDPNYKMTKNQLEKGIIEYVGEFPDQFGGVTFAGMDFAKQIDSTVLCIIRMVSDGRYKIVYFLEIKGTDYAIQGNYILAALGKYRTEKAWADRTGVGEAFVDYLNRISRQSDSFANLQSIEPVYLTNMKKQEIFGNSFPYVAQQLVTFPVHHQFKQEMIHLKREVTPEGNLKIIGPEEMSDVNDDYPMAFALAMICEYNPQYGKFYVGNTPSYADSPIHADRDRDAFNQNKVPAYRDDDDLTYFYQPDNLNSTFGFSFSRGSARGGRRKKDVL